jgi:hypothetical protein
MPLTGFSVSEPDHLCEEHMPRVNLDQQFPVTARYMHIEMVILSSAGNNAMSDCKSAFCSVT